MTDSTPPLKTAGAFLLMALAAVALCHCNERQAAAQESAQAAAGAPAVLDPVDNRVATEEFMLEQMPALLKLQRAFLDLRDPAEAAPDLIDPAMAFSAPPTGADAAIQPPASAAPGIETLAAVPGAGSGSFFAYFLSWPDFYRHAKVYFIDGAFRDSTRRSFEASMGITGLARHSDGRWISLEGTQAVTWTEKSGQWRISAWRQDTLQVMGARRFLFEEVLTRALPERDTWMQARRSIHEENLIDLFTKGSFRVTRQRHADYRDLDSTYQHPALSVVDINRDGWDDLYVMARWGRNLLLVNQRDGTFAEQAEAWGLAVDGLCNVALFADFDNDGDSDAFIGRSLEPSLYLENTGNSFSPRPDILGGIPLPALVSSVAAADYNNDGLLDLYVGLYGPTANDMPVEKWAAEFFARQKPMQQQLVERAGKSHYYLERTGPPNLLLRNAGGGEFRIAPEAGMLAEWANTYQATWADYDNDGDADLYVCNDFAPDHLYRNDGGNGAVTFVDVTKELAGEAMNGFGMGASWADYDGDGLQDLYVSNMFSKAGKRITSTFDGLDPRVPYAAQGSLLFHNEITRFAQVAGTGKPSLLVAKVGWSFGGHFVDFDNDSRPDIYSASGFYTAPEAITTNKDL